MSKPDPKTDELTFEDAMRRLEEIVAGMEDDGQLTLEEMISSYENGVRLLKLCRQQIEGARRRVEVISGDLEGGKASLTPFEDAPAEEGGDGVSAKPRSSLRRRKNTDEEGGEIRLF